MCLNVLMMLKRTENLRFLESSRGKILINTFISNSGSLKMNLLQNSSVSIPNHPLMSTSSGKAKLLLTQKKQI